MKKQIIALCMMWLTTIVSGQTMSEKLHNFYSALTEMDTEERNKRLESAIKNNPKEPWYYLMRAEFSMIMGEDIDAEKDYKAALEVNPSFGASYGLYARFLYTVNSTQESLSKALTLIDKAIKLDPSEGYYLLDKGEIYSGLGQYEKALEQAELVIKRFPDFESDGIELKVKALYFLEDKEKLHRYFKQTPAIMEIFFVDLDVVMMVGSVYEELKMFDNACGVYLAYADFLADMEDDIPAEIAQKLQSCE